MNCEQCISRWQPYLVVPYHQWYQKQLIQFETQTIYYPISELAFGKYWFSLHLMTCLD